MIGSLSVSSRSSLPEAKGKLARSQPQCQQVQDPPVSLATLGGGQKAGAKSTLLINHIPIKEVIMESYQGNQISSISLGGTLPDKLTTAG
ncbi:Hepatocyte Growth Factor Receptor [Manis pentadactyla]|nr:Hepatocyte Growth Factor Receptor [Manis pentadactyla]